jgi:hypothetical protein
VSAQVRLADVPCEPPPAYCSGEYVTCGGVISETGNVVEPNTGRPFFLDYSCGLESGQDAIFILNVHGIGSNANWQRHYFPAFEYKDEYDLILASGKSVGTSFSADADDEYVRGMIDYVAEAFSDVNLVFWVAGHSAGGGASRSWMCGESALRDRVVGSISLAGGRLGGSGGRGGGGGGPDCGEFSHIYSTGDQDALGGNPVPTTSTVAEALGCDVRIRHPDIVDEHAGHVWDSRDREPPFPGWGGEARPGTTESYEFPNCRDGRVVADFIRLDKGHTEGLEPDVTRAIVELVVRASR